MRNIHKSTPPSFRRRENAAAIVKAPPLGINFKNGPTPDRGAVPNPAKRRRHAFSAVAFLAAVVFGLLFLLPGGLLRAQDDGTIEYAENGTDPVATYTGLDPEGRPVYWSLETAPVDLSDPANQGAIDPEDVQTTDIADEGQFTISSDGVLRFKLPPNFEMPDDGGEDNEYKVVVVASDNARGAGTPSNPIKMAYHKVTVTVTDVDEDGSISLSAAQPQDDVALTATLTDQDATDAQMTAKWKWEQAPAMNGPWIVIVGTTDDMYSPVAGVVDKYLRVTATYTDKHGDDKTAMAVSAHAVRAKPAGTNSSPVFPEGSNARKVKENSPPGTNVGKPVAAGDAGDILTYTLTGLTGNDDDSNYRIDRATGQITVGPRAMLNREDPGNPDFEHMVTVTATDPWGIPTAGDQDAPSAVTVIVTITIDNVNEAPMVNAGPTKIIHPEGITVINVGTADVVKPPTYMATDQESTVAVAEDPCTIDSTGSTCAWSLRGYDAGDFSITEAGVLTFKSSPNFESPADADMDNMYMVTVVATDDGTPEMTATRDVVITVTNTNEDGSVTFSSVQPKVGRPFTASLTDPDDVTSTNTDGSIETGVTWEWWRTTSASEENFPAADDQGARGGWEKIADTKSDTYKPVSGDVNRWLTAMATYTDRRGPGNAMHKSSNNAVVENTDNVAPEFKEGGDKPVMQATRKIAENSVSDTTDDTNPGDVGKPVAATDPNGDPETAEGRLTHTLGGPDKDSFEIDASSGQITVAADTELDYESNKKTYMVTVTATDPSRAMTTIDVTINVTDVNEPPSFTAPSEGDVDKTVRENTTSLNIYTFQATDPERRKVYWSLRMNAIDSPDDNQFTISDRGALSLNASPDYEDEGLGPEKEYTVIVVASDDAPGAGIDDNEEDLIKTSMKTVTVTVTDMEETGTITLAPKYPHVGTAVTATLTDGDGVPSIIVWKWTASGGDVGSDSASYTPGDGDIRKTLRVEASYEEAGEGKVVGPVSAGNVRGAPPAKVNPEFTDSPENNARKVAENARVGTRLGKAINAIDADGTPTYTVDNANFSISTSGQLSTAAILDHEDEETQAVAITATDPWGGTDAIDVTVTVEDVNEAPMINTGPTRRDHAENTPITTLIGDYGATDVDEGDTLDLTWSLEGEDAAKFNIVEADGMLTFEESPNYEMPADRNKDNVYKVTVVVSDDGPPKLMDKRQVEVTVTNVEEDGTVTLSAVQPKIGIDLMASLTDPDNVTSTNTDGSIETGVTWQWWRTTSASEETTVPDFPAADDQGGRGGWEKIADAKSDTYKPVSDDVNRWLTAMATYTDRRGPGNTMYKSSNNAVIVNTDNVAPMFKVNNEEITETTRKVDEDAKPNVESASDGTEDQGNVDTPVMAEDLNGEDLLTYTLSGPDMALFKITSDTRTTDDATIRGGQISLNANTELDYEDRTTYMVTVTAADPDGEMASVDVTIKVTGVDEAPKIIVGGLVVRGTSDINYAENGTGMVATYSAAGPDAAGATWSLSGADAGDLSISSAGVLTFMAPPNYESPADANIDNIYMVMVNANDGTNDAMKAVTVRVTNENEQGRVTFWRDGADATTAAIVVGDELGGAVDDSDGNPNDTFPIAMYTRIAAANVTSWQWAKTMTPDMMASWMDITGATDAAYTVMDADEGYHLRATAMYGDGEGMGKMASMKTMMVTMNASPMFDSETAERMVPENTAAGENVGDPVTAMDADNDTLTYRLSGTDMASFDIGSATGQLMTRAALDYEAKASYEVMVTATDPEGASGMITVTITVTNAEETGEVTLWAGDDALTMAPQVGDTITGAVMDPDGGVTGESWQWSRTMDDMDSRGMDSWMPITDATNAAYMVTEGDTGYYLRVMATYTDAVGTDMAMEYSPATMMVGADDAGDPLLVEYDPDGDGVIEKADMRRAVGNFFVSGTLSRQEMRRLVGIYFSSS